MENLKVRLDAMVEDGWLISQVHPTLDLTIYNYSQKTQYASYWVEETLMARGLVLNSAGDIVARPFGKFFNASEVPDQIPNLAFEVFEKMDGSLGIFFWYYKDDILYPVFASRGSFTSDQAVKGWEMLQKLPYRDLAYGHTHMFEIIYPENRIVVDYGAKEELVLLGINRTESCREIPFRDIEESLGQSFNLVKVYNIKENWDHLVTLNEPNKEGFVIRFSNSFRVKVKFEEYVRLHRIITNVSTTDIWESLMTGESLDEVLERVPDEFFDWVRETQAELLASFNLIKETALNQYQLVCIMVPTDGLSEREYGKAFAERVAKNGLKHLLFGLKNGKSIDTEIWKMIKPKWSKPFKKETTNI